MFEYPQYEENGQERLFFPNLWRDIQPQLIVGADCFVPNVNLNTTDNLIVLKLTAIEFTEIFSALRNGAEKTYPDRFLQIMVNFLKGLHCPPLMIEQECYEYPTYSAFIQYSPENPYIDPTTVPDGYLIPPFQINGENGVDDPELEHYDIIVPYGAFELLANWFELLDGLVPQIKIMVNGAGHADIRLLTMTFGGLAVITVDTPPNLVDIIIGIVTGADNIIDLNLDDVSVPPETAREIIFPVDIVGSGIHTIYIDFLPIMDDSFVPLRFGGGFRGVQLCNFVEEPEMGITAVRLNADTCALETQLNGEWTAVSGWENINDCVIPTTISQEAIDAGLEASTIIDAIEENQETAQTEITQLQSQETAQNVVPAPSTITMPDKICNAASYIADKLLALSLEAWEASGDITIEEFLTALLELGSGYVGEFLTDLYDAAVPADTSTPDDLTASKTLLQNCIYCVNLDKEAARAEVVASTILSNAKDLILASFDAITGAKWALWAFVGSETALGSCFCGNTKVWDFTLGSQLGWQPQNGDRATWLGNAWGQVTQFGNNIIVVERPFTWPTDLVLTEVRYYVENYSSASLNIVWGMPYTNGVWNSANIDGHLQAMTTDIVKGTRTGLGVEFSVFTGSGKSISRIEADFTGTPSPNW